MGASPTKLTTVRGRNSAMAANQTLSVEFDGQLRTLSFGKNSSAAELCRAICVACAVPWGCEARLVDSAGAEYPMEPSSLPDGKTVGLEILGEPGSLSLPTTLGPASFEPARIADQTTILPESERSEGGPIPEPTAELKPLKIVVCGDTGVGKTSFISRLKSKNPRKFKLPKEAPPPTEGVDVTSIELQTNRGSKKEPETAVLKLWEVGGGEDKAGLRSTYYRGADAALVFFRFGRVSTYWSAIRWRNQLVAACGNDLPIFVCGLGADSQDAKPLAERAPEKPGPPLSESAAKWKAATLAMVETPCLAISCKTGTNVYTPVNYLLQLVTGDPAVKCKKDGGIAEIETTMMEWHGLCSHITSTFQGLA